jgi:hypothetical protein
MPTDAVLHFRHRFLRFWGSLARSEKGQAEKSEVCATTGEAPRAAGVYRQHEVGFYFFFRKLSDFRKASWAAS